MEFHDTILPSNRSLTGRKERKAMNKTVTGASSIRKCLSVLDCFTEETPRLSLSQTAERTGFSMPTTLRVLSVLCEEGFLERGEDRLYQPSW